MMRSELLCRSFGYGVKFFPSCLIEVPIFENMLLESTLPLYIGIGVRDDSDQRTLR